MQEAQETRVQSPGEGNGNPLQYSCLGNPFDREATLGFKSSCSAGVCGLLYPHTSWEFVWCTPSLCASSRFLILCVKFAVLSSSLLLQIGFNIIDWFSGLPNYSHTPSWPPVILLGSSWIGVFGVSDHISTVSWINRMTNLLHETSTCQQGTLGTTFSHVLGGHPSMLPPSSIHWSRENEGFWSLCPSIPSIFLLPLLGIFLLQTAGLHLSWQMSNSANLGLGFLPSKATHEGIP